MNKVQKLQVEKDLQKAKELLIERGWTQGQQEDIVTGSLCISGAVCMAIWDKSYEPYSHYGNTRKNKRFKKAMDVLGKSIAKTHLNHYPDMDVVLYNDEVARNRRDILGLINRALKNVDKAE